MDNKYTVLILDDEASIVEVLERIFAGEYRVAGFTEVDDARRFLQREKADVLLLDYRLDGINGLDVLREFKKEYPDMETIMITGYGEVATAVDAIKSGAFHFLSKPIEAYVIRNLVKKAIAEKYYESDNRHLKELVETRYSSDSLVGSSVKMRNLKAVVERAKMEETSVLLIGEPGTGKELVARIIHYGSNRTVFPFREYNCGKCDSVEKVEVELFGSVNSESPGYRPGILEQVGNGTVLISDITMMSGLLQRKIYEVLSRGHYYPLGAQEPRKNFARLIFSVTQTERELADEGLLESDLLKKLNQFPVLLPPLRERLGDVAELAHYFLARVSRRLGKDFAGFTPGAMQKLNSYNWPGNVRHLENIVERMAILEEETIVTEKNLPPEVSEESDNCTRPRLGISYRQYLKACNDTYSKEYLRFILKETGGNVTKAAQLARMKRESFHRLLKKHRVNAKNLR